MNIYIAKNGQQTGSFTVEQILASLANGSTSSDDLGWHEGLSGWMPLSSIPDIRSKMPPPPPRVVRPAPPIQSIQSAPSPQPTVIINQPAPSQTNGMAIAGFVLALLALFCSWVPGIDFVLWLLGLVFSIIGLRKKPNGLAIAGVWISFIGIILIIILIAAFGLFAAAVAANAQ